MMKFVRRAAVALVPALGLVLVARVAPAEVPVQVGRRIVMTVPVDHALPSPPEIVQAVRGPATESHGHKGAEIQIGVEKNDAKATITLELWGAALPEGSAADRLRAAFPALADAEITESTIEGTAHVSLADKIGHELFDNSLDPEAVERAIREVVARVHEQEGPDAKVDVQVSGEPGSGERKVMIRVEKDDKQGGHGEDRDAVIKKQGE